MILFQTNQWNDTQQLRSRMSRSEKPHRSSPATDDIQEEDDPFKDRRLSDLLPSEIVRQIGFDRDCYLFPRAHATQRRMTDPILFQINPDPSPIQRRSTMLDKFENAFQIQVSNQSPLIENQMWYLVELSDVTVNCYSTFPISTNTSDGVVVHDGNYLRFGRILDELRNAKPDRGAPQIICVDKDCELGDHVSGLTQVASAVIPSFMAKARCTTRFLSIETASYQGRALFRIKVQNVEDPSLDKVVRMLIQMFSIAVELYD